MQTTINVEADCIQRWMEPSYPPAISWADVVSMYPALLGSYQEEHKLAIGFGFSFVFSSSVYTFNCLRFGYVPDFSRKKTLDRQIRDNENLEGLGIPVMADLPAEVITDILSHLPVKSLLRLRATCKWWRSLIDKTHFIFFHLSKSIDTKNWNISLLLRHRSHLYQVNLHALDEAVELNHPLMCYSSSINVLGSCNGLLCISNIADDFALWNPSLRKHRILPADRLNRPQSSLFAARVYGFGYDPFTNDYKLVSISYFVDLHNRSFDSQVQLYSLRSDAWKVLPSMPYALCCARTMGVFVGVALHWVVTRKLEPNEPDLIVSFDLRLESFREVPLPVSVNGNFEMNVAQLGGCLCMVEDRGSGFDVWVMRVYGSRESWCKLFTVTRRCELTRSMKCVKPLALGFWGDGDRVLFEQDRSKLYWYHLKSGNVSCVKISGMPNSVEGTLWVGSLVPPSILTLRDDTKRHRMRDPKITKKRDDFLSQGFKLTL
ncbi:hypothetical protein VNO77_05986 [Canavalia gladiata]|uniref:F-box domain-containing protein n=1 Tax=Canavalia gladiata TaxID=3824 RepID=A0AAN9REQ2_CANGL